MIDESGVESVSPAEPQDLNDEMLSSIEETDVTEDSSTSDPQVDPGDSDSDTVKVEADGDEQEAEKEEEVVPKASFLRRINGLQASRRKAEERTLGLESKLAQYEQAFDLMHSRLQQAEAKVGEYEVPDPRDQEIREYKHKEQEREIRARLEQEASERQQRYETERVIEDRAAQIIDEASKLAEKFPTVTAEELVFRYQTAGDTSLADIAKELDSKRTNYFRTKLASQHPAARRAPNPVTPQGAGAPIGGHSEEDMMRYLESLGE